MAFLVLASTVSWTVDRHLCMGRVLDISLFSQADDCGMGMEMEPSCCDTDSFTVQGQDHLKGSLEQPTVDQPYFLAAFGQPTPLFLVERSKPVLAFVHYSPPPLLRDAQLLYQTFLI